MLLAVLPEEVELVDEEAEEEGVDVLFSSLSTKDVCDMTRGEGVPQSGQGSWACMSVTWVHSSKTF